MTDYSDPFRSVYERPVPLVLDFTDNTDNTDDTDDIHDNKDIDIVSDNKDLNNDINNDKEINNELSEQINEPEIKERIILYHNYLFDEVVKEANKNIEDHKISCRICLQNFTENEKQLYVCHICNNLCHSKCGDKASDKCPYCRAPSKTARVWYNIIKSGSTVFDTINTLGN